jgi:hypothetical protein
VYIPLLNLGSPDFDLKLGLWVQIRARESSVVTFRARLRGEYKPHGGVRFCRSSSDINPSGERARGARPRGATLRGYVPRANPRRNPKIVADILKFVGLFTFLGRGISLSDIGWRRCIALENQLIV